MPSEIYTIAIASVSDDAPADGFIDNTKIEDYLPDSAPETYAESVTKERANRRYQMIIDNLQRFGNCYVTAIAAPAADAQTAPTSFTMTVNVEHGGSEFITEDDTEPGTFLSGANALRRCVARALMTEVEVLGDIYDPTETTGDADSASVRVGNRRELITVGALYDSYADESGITVTKVV